MGIIKKVKLWWRSTTPTEKILTVLGGITATASTVGAVYAVKSYMEMDDKLNIEVKLYPKGKDDPNPKTLLPHLEDEDPKPEPPEKKIPADTTTEKWDVWNPDWEPVRKSADGYEGTRLNDALDVLLTMDGMMKSDGYVEDDDVRNAEARVEDLARQFAYLEGREDEFRKRFPYLKDTTCDIYENVEEKKGE